MSTPGFVYILGNTHMPGRYKVGFTLNSPFRRAQELSRATGVPGEFTVLGFVAFDEPQRAETWMHRRFVASRVDGGEFFACPLRGLWEAISENEYRSAACDVEIGPWVWDEEHP